MLYAKFDNETKLKYMYMYYSYKLIHNEMSLFHIEDWNRRELHRKIWCHVHVHVNAWIIIIIIVSFSFSKKYEKEIKL